MLSRRVFAWRGAESLFAGASPFTNSTTRTTCRTLHIRARAPVGISSSSGSITSRSPPRAPTLTLLPRPFVNPSAPLFRFASTTTAATMGSLPEPVKVFIVGGCYAGLSAALNLIDLSQGKQPRQAYEAYEHHPDLPRFDVDITIVDERDGYFHVIGSPLALADSDYAKKAWVKYDDLPGIQFPNVKIIQGTVSNVDCAEKSATVLDGVTKEPSTHHYDYLITASGLRRVWPVVPQSLTRKQYLLEAEGHIDATRNAKHGVVIVGGGAVGIEMAAELKLVRPEIKVTLAHSRDKLLSSEGLPDECKDKALELLQEAGVETLMNHRLATTTKVETTDGSVKYDLEFTNGHKMAASDVVMAISKSVPSTTYLPSSALNEEGYVKIQPNLNFVPGTPNHESHYSAGDIIKWSGIKRCGAAMHTGQLVAQNIHKRILKERVGQEPKFQEIKEIPPMIGLAVGKKAVAYGPEVGVTFGEDVAKAYFNDDLGWSICWNWMQLGGRKEDSKV